MAGNKPTDQHTIISRGLDNRNTPDKTKKGYAQEMYNMDTNTSGYIEKRKGYQHFRELPIRITNIVVSEDSIELTLPDSIDASLIEVGPVVISQYTEFGSASYYFESYENLSNFTIEGNQTVEVDHGRGLEVGISLLQQDPNQLIFAESVIPSGIENTEDGGTGKYTSTYTFSPDGGDSTDLFTPIVVDPAIEVTSISTDLFTFTIPAVGATDTVRIGEEEDEIVSSSVTKTAGGTVTVTIELDADLNIAASFFNYKHFLLKRTSGTVAGNQVGATREKVIPDSFEISLDTATNNRTLVMTLQVASDETDTYSMILHTVDDSIGGEPCVIQDIIPETDPSNPNQQLIKISGVSVRYNTVAIYRLTADSSSGAFVNSEEEVIPNQVIYDADARELCCYYSVPSGQNAQIKLVRVPSTPIVAGIEVENPAAAVWTSAQGLISNPTPEQAALTLSEVSGTWVHGFSQDIILTVNNREQYREIKKVDEWSGKQFNKLVAISQGDLWNDSPEEENRQYFPVIDADLQDIHGPDVTEIFPFFGNYFQSQTSSRERGVIAENIDADNSIAVTSITNNRDQTATVSFDLGVIQQGSIDSLVIGVDELTIDNSEVPSYKGNWTISAIDSVNQTITVSIPDLADYEKNVVASGTRAKITTDFIDLAASGQIRAELEDKLNLIAGTEIFRIDSSRIWVRGLVAMTVLQPAIPISYIRKTDHIPLKNVNWFVTGDLVTLVGYTRKFKVLAVDLVNKTIKIDEPVEITGRAGQVTSMKLDGRLILPRYPESVVNVNDTLYPDIAANYVVKSGSLSNSVFFTNDVDPIQKYDGVSVVDAGIPNWPIRSNTWIEESDGAALLPAAYTFTDAVWDAGVLTCPFFVGMPPLTEVPAVNGRVDIKIDGVVYQTTLKEYDAANKEIKLNVATDVTGTGTGSFYIPTSFRYYLRLGSVDRNLQITSGPSTGAGESIVTIYSPSIVRHKATVFPTEAAKIEWSRLRVGLFRTLGYPKAIPASATANVFYPVSTKRFPELQGFAPSEALISGSSVLFEDTKPDVSIDLNSSDSFSVAVKGAELPQVITNPPKSNYMTNVGNKMIYAGIKSTPRIDVDFEDLRQVSFTENSFLRTAVCLTKVTGSINWKFGGDQRFVFYNTPFIASDVLEVNGEDLVESIVESVSSLSTVSDSTGTFVDLVLDTTSFSSDWKKSDYVQIVGTGNVKVHGILAGHHRVITVDDSNPASTSLRLMINKEAKDQLATQTYVADSLEAVFAFASSGGSYDEENIMVIPLLCRTDETITHDQTSISDGGGIASNRLGMDLGRAINDVMRAQDFISKQEGLVYDSTKLSGLEGFCQARWGESVGFNKLAVESFKDTVEFAIDYTHHDQTDAVSYVQVFINGYIPRRLTESTDSALDPVIDYTDTIVDIKSKARIFNSRVVLSYDNFPSVVDNPFTLFEDESDSIIDVASDDGQVITGISGFFGISAGEDTNLSSYILVFKESSVYVVDPNRRTAKQLQTWGQGCTLPESIVAVDGRVFFANATGVYVIDRNLTLDYVGRNIESYWKDHVNKKGDAVGFIDSLNRKYKLSVSVEGETTCSETAVYDFIKTPEVTEGAWVTYDNIPSRSWKETTEGVYFGNYESKIFSIRNIGDKTDYRDDSQGIISSWTYGAQSFGDKTTRVTVNRVNIYIDGKEGITDLIPSDSTDFEDFQSMDEIDREETKRIYSIGLSPNERTSQFYQFRLDHGTKDENLVVTSVDFKITVENGLGTDQTVDF